MSAEIAQLSQLTLTEIRERLNDRGIKVANSTLSEIISSGDVSEQLQKEKVGNKTLYPPVAVEVLAEVIETIRKDSRLTWESAADVMRRVLTRESTSLSVIRETPNNAELVVLTEIRELLKADSQLRDDALLTMKAAHEAHGIPYAVLRSLRVTVGRRLYVRRSDCLRYIASL